MKQKVSVVGVGRLGLAFALLLDSKGYDVCGCDIDWGYVDSLKDKSFKSDEPCINELLAERNLILTTDARIAFSWSDLIFIFVPTPSKENGEYSHEHIEDVIFKIEKDYVRYKQKTIVIGCTVMPGYCETIKKRLPNYHVVYNPEFIAQGNILNGLRDADIVLFGGKVPTLLMDVYKSFMSKPPYFKFLSHTGAEIAKIAINCFLTMKIAYANMIGEIVTNSGAEVVEVLEAIGSDSRIGRKYLGYGFPAGGVCLPRDQKALGTYAHKVGIDTTFTFDIDRENQRHSEYLKEYWMKQNPDRNVPFQFSYLGYKEGVNILTQSYQLKLCMDLLQEGYKVIVPQIEDMDLFKFHSGVSFEPTKDAIRVN